MNAAEALWMLAGYVAGTFPSTWIVSRLSGSRRALEGARRDASASDAHILINQRAGHGWATLAAILDVFKGLALPLAARRWGHLDDPWVAMTGVAAVVGHSFPFYLRSLAGRGLAAASGVHLALLPIPMVIAGLTICVGLVLRQTAVFSAVGFAAIPLLAGLMHAPGSFVAMGVAVFVLIMIRRVEGLSRMVRETGLSPWRAAWLRAMFDPNDDPRLGTVGEPGEERTQA